MFYYLVYSLAFFLFFCLCGDGILNIGNLINVGLRLRFVMELGGDGEEFIILFVFVVVI